jgi:hypothetical protein
MIDHCSSRQRHHGRHEPCTQSTTILSTPTRCVQGVWGRRTKASDPHPHPAQPNQNNSRTPFLACLACLLSFVVWPPCCARRRACWGGWISGSIEISRWGLDPRCVFRVVDPFESTPGHTQLVIVCVSVKCGPSPTTRSNDWMWRSDRILAFVAAAPQHQARFSPSKAFYSTPVFNRAIDLHAPSKPASWKQVQSSKPKPRSQSRRRAAGQHKRSPWNKLISRTLGGEGLDAGARQASRAAPRSIDLGLRVAP